jgi:NADPH:quinone reductase-like Zn-dependent oxidoreductase
MKAIVQDRYGSADVLEFSDIPVPAVGENEVLVRVHAAGSGPDVWHIMEGKPYFARLALGLRRPKARVRGGDVAGVVEAVGSGVTGFAPGDEVMGYSSSGSFAEFAVVPVGKVAAKPPRLSFEEAAAVPISGATALRALQAADVSPGKKVLVTGAGGGVGTFTVQIAKALGAVVTGVASGSKAELVRSIGADDVIDYTREDFADGSRRWDVIVDMAGRRPLRELRRALTPRGTLVVVGGDGGGPITGGFFRGLLRGPLMSLFVRQKMLQLNTKERAEDLVALNELIEAGKIRPVIDRTYSLIEAPDAIRYLAEGHPRGKIVITVVG